MNNTEIKNIINNINASLFQVEIKGDSTLIMAECRKALSQLITLIPEDEDVKAEPRVQYNTKWNTKFHESY